MKGPSRVMFSVAAWKGSLPNTPATVFEVNRWQYRLLMLLQLSQNLHSQHSS